MWMWRRVGDKSLAMRRGVHSDVPVRIAHPYSSVTPEERVDSADDSEPALDSCRTANRTLPGDYCLFPTAAMQSPVRDPSPRESLASSRGRDGTPLTRLCSAALVDFLGRGVSSGMSSNNTRLVKTRAYLGIVSGWHSSCPRVAAWWVPVGDVWISRALGHTGRRLSDSGHRAHRCSPGGIGASGRDSGRMPSATARDHERAYSWCL